MLFSLGGVLLADVSESAPYGCVWITPLTPTETFPSAGAPPAESYFVHDQISAAVSNLGVRAAGGCWRGLNHRFNQWLLTLLSRLIPAGHARGLHARTDLFIQSGSICGISVASLRWISPSISHPRCRPHPVHVPPFIICIAYGCWTEGTFVGAGLVLTYVAGTAVMC